MNKFEYVRAKSAKEAVDLLAATKGAVIKASGTDLLDRIKSFIDTPPRLVSLSGATEMTGVEVEAGSTRLGALATLAKVAERIKTGPLLALGQAAGDAATPQIRNVATVGGNICQRPRCWYYRLGEVPCLKKGGKECPALAGDNRYHAIFDTSPCPIVHPSNLAGPLVAFGATIHVHGPSGVRDIPADQFFTLPKVDINRENVLAREDVITSVSVPAWEGARSAYLEAREKESFDWSLVNATAVLQMDGDVVKDARLVLGSVAPVPRRVPAAEKALVGKKIDEASAAEAARVAFADATPLPGNAYKVPMGRAIARRAILAAAGLWKE
jgi:xanthine dehydrogenase YagS FAD-binding subunit